MNELIPPAYVHSALTDCHSHFIPWYLVLITFAFVNTLLVGATIMISAQVLQFIIGKQLILIHVCMYSVPTESGS